MSHSQHGETPGEGAPSFLTAAGSDLVDARGRVIHLRGVALGGWMNMENFITGFPANESAMRNAVRDVLGDAKYELFFEGLLNAFFDDDDARFLADCGLTALRLPVNYRHFEEDSRPFQIRTDGFRHLDRVIDLCAARGIYSIVDLHALPGYQNQRWHSDNPTHVASFWTHPHFQDRVVHLWEAFADHYKDNPWVAGYNPINEPADDSRRVVGPFYERLVSAIRAVDPQHTVFLDGNTYSTEFDVFTREFENVVYACHDYAAPGLGFGGPYPGQTRGVYVDKEAVERKFLERSAYSRKTTTPVWVGEFGPIYTGNEQVDVRRQQLLADQLEIYGRHHANWSLWTYKDIGMQGLACVKPGSAYGSRFGAFVAKKTRLGADAWGSTGEGLREVTQPVQEMIAQEAADFNPYPWGRWDWVKTLLLNIAVAQSLVGEYAELFRGLTGSDLMDLADSFAFRNCAVREPLHSQLVAAVRGNVTHPPALADRSSRATGM
jgi:endoglucanase